MNLVALKLSGAGQHKQRARAGKVHGSSRDLRGSCRSWGNGRVGGVGRVQEELMQQFPNGASLPQEAMLSPSASPGARGVLNGESLSLVNGFHRSPTSWPEAQPSPTAQAGKRTLMSAPRGGHFPLERSSAGKQHRL